MRGNGVRDNNHVCTFVTHDKQISHYSRSERRWELKREQVGAVQYDRKKHLDWTDQHNFGITHFGIHPQLLQRDNIRFDTFHMKCALTRNLMSYTRAFILNQSSEIINQFSNEVLKLFWNDFQIFCVEQR